MHPIFRLYHYVKNVLLYFGTIWNIRINKHFGISVSIVYPNIDSKPPNHPPTLVKGIIGYAQQEVSITDYQTTKCRVNELTEYMDAYTSTYLTQGTSETLKKLYCLNLTKQQEQEYKSKQKRFHIPFDTSQFSENRRKFPHNV